MDNISNVVKKLYAVVVAILTKEHFKISHKRELYFFLIGHFKLVKVRYTHFSVKVNGIYSTCICYSE